MALPRPSKPRASKRPKSSKGGPINGGVADGAQFKDGILLVRGYRFEKPLAWGDPGTARLVAEGVKIDGSTEKKVIAKIGDTEGVVGLEREAHILTHLSRDAEASSRVFRVLDFISIPAHAGGVKVLVLSHPGENHLAQYVSRAGRKSFLLPGQQEAKTDGTTRDEPNDSPSLPPALALVVNGAEEPEPMGRNIDLSSFLHFALQAAHCLEVLHAGYGIHGDIRPETFHWNESNDTVRFAHFGQRSIHIDGLGTAARFILEARQLSEDGKDRVRGIVCYLSPEQIGASLSSPDHRSDLYGLGATLWRLLAGRRMFSGSLSRMLEDIRTQSPPLLHDVRSDVPRVLSDIVRRLLAKSPDERYASARGLKEDLLHCNSILGQGWVSKSGSLELIPQFPLGRYDRFSSFVIPDELFGREKETRHVQRAIQDFASRYREMKGKSTLVGMLDASQPSPLTSRRSSHSSGHESLHYNNQRPVLLKRQGEEAGIKILVARGTTGSGKSALMLHQCQLTAQTVSLVGKAQFQTGNATPYSAILTALSAIFRQFLTFSTTTLFAFVNALRERMGPIMSNIHLVFSSIPEIRDLLDVVGDSSGDQHVGLSQDIKSTSEARARFEDLMVGLVSTMASQRMITLFLDDIQDADAPSLSLLETFARARLSILILGTIRSDDRDVTDRLSTAFGTSLTFVNLQPLNSSMLSELVSRTLRQDPEACVPLVSSLIRHSRGIVFTARSLLLLLKNENYIVFDWNRNLWKFDSDAVDIFLNKRLRIDPENVDINFLLEHLRELPPNVQRFLCIAAAIGPTFDVKLVSTFFESSDSQSDSDTSEEQSVGGKLVLGWVSGLQMTLAEGMVTSRGHDLYAFTHDRYREASLDLANSQPGGIPLIASKLVDTLLDGNSASKDIFKISDYILRCIPVLMQRVDRQEYVTCISAAGSQAYSRGAPESALVYKEAAFQLMGSDVHSMKYPESNSVCLKLAELLHWKGDLSRADSILDALQNLSAEEKVLEQQIRARNLFSKGQWIGALEVLLHGLWDLGIDLKSEYSTDEAKTRYYQVRRRMLEVGLDNIKALPLTINSKTNLTSSLLSEMFLFAYYRSISLAQMVGFEAITLALDNGMSPSNALGFITFAFAAAQHHDFVLGAEVGKLALDLAQRHSTAIEKGRVHVFYVGLVASYDSVHFSQTWALSIQGHDYARAGGDPLFAAFAQAHAVSNKLLTSNLAEAITYSEEVLADLSHLPRETEALCFIYSVRNTAKALTGATAATSSEAALDHGDWDDAAYRQQVRERSHAPDLALNWYQSYRLCALYSLGFHQAAVDVGEFTSATARCHPSHRHNQLALFYQGLALCEVVRTSADEDRRNKYLARAKEIHAQLAIYLEPAGINIAQWVHLLGAELASITGAATAIKLYDQAVLAAEEGKWIIEAGWASYLAGCHFERIGAKVFAQNLHQKGLAFFASAGASGVVARLSGKLSGMPSKAVSVPTQDAGVQTNDVHVGDLPGELRVRTLSDATSLGMAMTASVSRESNEPPDNSIQLMIDNLSSRSLATLIKAQQTISSDVNLSSSLERMTGVLFETTGLHAEHACIVVRDEENSDFRLFTQQSLNKACTIFDPPRRLDTLDSSNGILVVSIMQHVLHSGETLVLPRIVADPRFSSFVAGHNTELNSVMAAPIRSKGITVGALYVASSRVDAFTEGNKVVLDLLTTQAGVIISNGLLFASLRKSTHANLRAIAEQRSALEAARKSQDQALEATRVKSIFLANMSHEMRTPFASFYGLLGLLAETQLNPEQQELVATARQSCELLLETISTLLDFSKLEAHAVKLNLAPVSPNGLIIECQELLITLASDKGLDLTYNVDPDVPSCVDADGPRIRQVLQNLMGNALKFTQRGFVDAKLSIDKSGDIVSEESDHKVLRFDITDTGIGLAEKDATRLFVPFSQVDESTTKRYGGTGLGLSICRELLSLMGGDIAVSSTVGEGSRFTFRIPVHVSRYPSSQVAEQTAEATRLLQTLAVPHSPTIVLFSASPSTQSLLQTSLVVCQVLTLTSVDDLMEHLGRFASPPETSRDVPPDVVIFDANQDRLDDLMKLLETTDALHNTHVIYLVARTAETIRLGPGRTVKEERRFTNPRLSRCNKPIRPLRILHLLSAMRSSVSANHARVPELVPRATVKTSNVFTDEQLEQFKTVNVLIAEDNPVAQKLLFRQLTNLGFKVTASSNGEEAVENWQAESPGHYRVAFFDHHMPICDGLTAAQHIRSFEADLDVTDTLPIISLTADAQSQAENEAKAAGMQMYLTKPLRADDLVEVIHRYILRSGQ